MMLKMCPSLEGMFNTSLKIVLFWVDSEKNVVFQNIFFSLTKSIKSISTVYAQEISYCLNRMFKISP